jgi:dTDP-4-amino-4,6-dideoxygalactose transaminase
VRIPIIDLSRQHAAIADELRGAIDRVFGHSHFILGQEVVEFERAVAAKSGVEYAVGVASGSDAILLALHALGIGRGDEVILPTFTFFSTASSVTRLGAMPIFCDINSGDYNIDVADAASKITGRTRAIIAVHLYGQMADMAALRELTLEHGLWLVEDAAQAIGAHYDGVGACACGDVGCLSFFPTKNLGGVGDGGMVVTDNDEIAESVALLRAHGANPKYFHRIVGYNSRLDALQAAVLNVKLAHLEDWSRQRQAHAREYDRRLDGVGDIRVPTRALAADHIFHQYTIATAKRDALRGHLSAAGMGSEIYYPRALHLQECFHEFGGRVGDCPMAERACEQVLSLPIFPEMTADEQSRIIDTIIQFYR